MMPWTCPGGLGSYWVGACSHWQIDAEIKLNPDPKITKKMAEAASGQLYIGDLPSFFDFKASSGPLASPHGSRFPRFPKLKGASVASPSAASSSSSDQQCRGLAQQMPLLVQIITCITHDPPAGFFPQAYAKRQKYGTGEVSHLRRV